ncbi:MAG: YlxR family protein [Selenomonadales bacterium]|nr:YlxR family protein [Selenomonadales bacterium]
MVQKKIPQRMCVGCQEMKNKKELIRIVRTPESEILLDPTGKKSGRGAYVCPCEECVTKAYKEKRLEKSLKCAVGADVYETLKAGVQNV